MIKKFATMVALSLMVGVIGMVPASATTTYGCVESTDLLTVTVGTGESASIGIDDEGHVWCDNSANAFDGSDQGDNIDEILVNGEGNLVLMLDNNDHEAADWDQIDEGFMIDDLVGTITFEGGDVEDGNLNVRITDDEFSFLGTSGDYDDRYLTSVIFNDGEDSDTFDASGVDVELEVTLSQGGSDVVRGGNEDDTITVSSDDHTVVYGNDGDDTLTDEGDASNTFYGGDDDDEIVLDGDSGDTAFPGTGDDNIDGASIVSYADLGTAVRITDNGDDSETGLAAGDDDFDSAPDVFIATSQDDILVGGVDGDATLFAGAGDDTVYSNNSNKVYGGMGDDLLIGSDLSNYLYGNAGVDTLRGKRGNDYLFGGAGRDMLYGGRGADVCGGEVLNSCEFVR